MVDVGFGRGRQINAPFGEFAEECLSAISPRLGEGTAAKYRSRLDSQLLPQWSAWPVIGIFNSYVEIEKWVSELHEDYAEFTVSSVFATFSTFPNAAVCARRRGCMSRGSDPWAESEAVMPRG